MDAIQEGVQPAALAPDTPPWWSEATPGISGHLVHEINFKRENQVVSRGLWKAWLVPTSPLPLNTEL